MVGGKQLWGGGYCDTENGAYRYCMPRAEIRPRDPDMYCESAWALSYHYIYTQL